MPSKHKKKTFIVIAKPHIRVGDQVVLRVGSPAVRGKTGTVIKILTDRNRALVEGACAQFETRHVEPNPQAGVEGGRVQRLRAIHLSNLSLLDPTTGKPTRVKRERSADGVVRVAKKSGHRFAVSGPSTK